MEDRWGDLAYALGGWSGRTDRETGKPIDGLKRRWKPNVKVLKAVIQYVKTTKRFQPKVQIDQEAQDAEDIGVGEVEEVVEG
jgi:hypothetical protein